MAFPIDMIERRTSADVVFEFLRGEILANKLTPGTRISEVEIATQFGVSRQPVRDAFNRLANQDLLIIRPQKPTEVRKFSLDKIMQARFVRLAVELEVVRRACSVWSDECTRKIDENLSHQRSAVEDDDLKMFHALDYRFHQLICELSNNGLMFEMIEHFKAKIDRLCMLSLEQASEASDLLDDHRQIAKAINRRQPQDAEKIVRLHLSRLDDTIRKIRKEHCEFFED